MVDIKFKLQRSSLTCCGVQLFSDSRGLTWKTARWTGCLRCNVGRACTGTRQALQDTDGSRNGYFRRVWQRGISVVGIVVVSFVVLSRSHLSEESGGLVLFWFAKCACQILAKFLPNFATISQNGLTQDIELLSDRQKFFPRCWGTGTTIESAACLQQCCGDV